VRHYTKHHLTSKHNPIVLQLGWQDQPHSNTRSNKNLAWALACNGFVIWRFLISLLGISPFGFKTVATTKQ
jgi:hypothetical protein